MEAATEKKKPGTAFPHNIPAQSIYGRGAPGAQPVPVPAQPAAPARNTAFPQNVPTRSIYAAPQGDTGVGAMVDSIFAPKAQEAAPTPTPAVAGMANRPLVASAASGAIAAAQGAPKPAAQAPVAPQAFGLENSEASIEGQFGRAMDAVVAPSGTPEQVARIRPGVSAPVTPGQATYSNEGKNYPAGGKAVAPVVAPAAAGAPGATNAPITSLGEGKQLGYGGIVRFDVPGKSPLFTNMTDEAGMKSNLALMNRGPVSAQNEAAANALSDKYAQERANVRNNEAIKQQYAAEVAQATAINKAMGEVSDRQSREIDFKRRDRELEVAAGSIQNTPQERAAIQQRRAELRTQFEGGNLSREKMTAEQAANQARLALDQQRVGIEQQRAGTEQQRVNNDVATGALTREARGMEISAARQIAGLQAQYMAATDPKVKQQLARQLATLSGKYEGGMKPQVIRGADTLGDGGQIVRGGERLIGVDPETGQVIDLTPGGAAAAKPAGPQAAPVKNQTYTDANGNKAYWDGSKYVPV